MLVSLVPAAPLPQTCMWIISSVGRKLQPGSYADPTMLLGRGGELVAVGAAEEVALAPWA